MSGKIARIIDKLAWLIWAILLAILVFSITRGS